jgi:phage FluMu protein Com
MSGIRAYDFDYRCRHCGGLLALAGIDSHPEEGDWVCPHCRRIECDRCEREATIYAEGLVTAGQPNSRPPTCRETQLLCSLHVGALKRRRYSPLWQARYLPLEEFLETAIWRTPVWLGEHTGLRSS